MHAYMDTCIQACVCVSSLRHGGVGGVSVGPAYLYPSARCAGAGGLARPPDEKHAQQHEPYRFCLARTKDTGYTRTHSFTRVHRHTMSERDRGMHVFTRTSDTNIHMHTLSYARGDVRSYTHMHTCGLGPIRHRLLWQ
jgi:hypothetical protein